VAVVGVVPARGGSKGIVKKNIRACAGRPLLAYTCDAALGSQVLDRVLLSTDDAEIAAVGRDCGLEVPFLRPASLATDTTPMVEVLTHVLDWLNSDQEIDAIVLLQPTSPLREAHHIDEAVELLVSQKAPTHGRERRRGSASIQPHIDSQNVQRHVGAVSARCTIGFAAAGQA
jgi:CMP-N-acetylneuraminic acid synthetase